jgi:hypothetical protein
LEWIWVDSFSSSYDHLHKLKGLSSYKFCLVSPELHGRTEKKEIINLKSKIKELGLNFEAICTKDPLVWIDSDFV